MERELTQAEIQEILREEGLVVANPNKTVGMNSSQSDIDESERLLQQIMEDGDDSYQAPPRKQKNLLSKSATSGGVRRSKQLSRASTDSNLEHKWKARKTLDPQDAISMLEEFSLKDRELADALLKTFKGTLEPNTASNEAA